MEHFSPFVCAFKDRLHTAWQFFDLFQRIQDRQFLFLGGSILQRIEIQGQDDRAAFGVFFSGFFVKSLTRLIAKKFVFYQEVQKLRHFHVGDLLVIRAVLLHPVDHVHRSIHADEVGQTEGAGFWATNGRAGKCIGGVNAKSELVAELENLCHGINAHPVGDKSRGVLAEDCLFA